MAPTAPLPGVFILDAHQQLYTCLDLMPVNSCMRPHIASQLLMQIVMHLILDGDPTHYLTNPLVSVDPAQAKQINDWQTQQLCTVVNTFASQDIGQFKYAFAEEIMLSLYQWYFETYLIVRTELNHYFPNFQQYEDGLPYTVKLYDTLLRFDHIPPSRNYSYVSDRTT